MKRVPQISLLILDNALDHAFYRPAEHWGRLLASPPEVVHVAGGDPLPEPGLHTHVIISGSESSVTSPPLWVAAEEAWVQRAADRRVSILGSCWGHQLIARALGGPRCVRTAAEPELGWRRVVPLGEDPLLPGDEFYAFNSHFDEVVPGSHPQLRVLARSDSCAVHALRWGQLPVWGIQSHPEMDRARGLRFLREAMERWPAHAELLRRAAAEQPRCSGAGRPLIERFLKIQGTRR